MKDITITTNAFNHALRLIRDSYPDMSEDRQIAQAVKLAEKICKKAKH